MTPQHPEPDPVLGAVPVPGPDAPSPVYASLDLALRVGEIMLSSGAGAADVAAQMRNVAEACGLRGAGADVMFTELAMTYQPVPEQAAVLQIRQVRYRETDYEDLTAVDHLVRDLVEGRVDRPGASARLKAIVSSGHARPRWAVTLAQGSIGGGVGLLVGGTWLVVLIAFVAGTGIDVIQRLMARRRLPAFYQQVAGGLFATSVAVGVTAVGVDLDPSGVVTASIILLLAGVNFLGAVQDALTGYPLTAGARILEAVLATAGVIAGVSGGFQVAALVGVDLGVMQPQALSLGSLPSTVLGGAITAAAYAYATYTPPRALAPIAAIGAVATAGFALAFDRSVGIAWSSALAALVVGLVAYSVAARVRVPALVIVVSTIVPLLPGLSIYRGLSDLASGGNGLVSMVSAASIAIALSSGAILGEYLAQPLRREARRLENRLAGPRLVGPIAIGVKRRTRARRRGGSGKGPRTNRKVS